MCVFYKKSKWLTNSSTGRLLGLSQQSWSRFKERPDSAKPFKGDADFDSKCDREGSKE